MKYQVRANFFAPKIQGYKNESLSHSLCYGLCNFNCIFCNFRFKSSQAFFYYDDSSFNALLDKLFLTGKNFKFSGGEATLNPKLIEHLTTVKARGGVVYLDSNGSNPKVIEKLLMLELIDVLGISLKGVTKEEAIQVSRAPSVLAWDNVFESMRIAGYHKSTQTIVTLVFTNATFNGRLVRFANLIKDIPSVKLKVNNLLRDDHESNVYELLRVPPRRLASEVERFILENPEWKGRTVLINSNQAVCDYSEIVFF